MVGPSKREAEIENSEEYQKAEEAFMLAMAKLKLPNGDSPKDTLKLKIKEFCADIDKNAIGSRADELADVALKSLFLTAYCSHKERINAKNSGKFIELCAGVFTASPSMEGGVYSTLSILTNLAYTSANPGTKGKEFAKNFVDSFSTSLELKDIVERSARILRPLANKEPKEFCSKVFNAIYSCLAEEKWVARTHSSRNSLKEKGHSRVVRTLEYHSNGNATNETQKILNEPPSDEDRYKSFDIKRL